MIDCLLKVTPPPNFGKIPRTTTQSTLTGLTSTRHQHCSCRGTDATRERTWPHPPFMQSHLTRELAGANCGIASGHLIMITITPHYRQLWRGSALAALESSVDAAWAARPVSIIRPYLSMIGVKFGEVWSSLYNGDTWRAKCLHDA